MATSAGHDDALTAFGARVRRFRRERSLSQEQLADLAGLHRNYVGGVERGERNIALLNIYRIARALQVNACDLLENDHHDAPPNRG